MLQRLLATISSSWARFSEALAGPVRATGAFAQSFLQPFFAALHKGLRSLVRHSLTEVVDSEAQPLDQGLDFFAENDDTLTLDPLDIPTGRLEAPSVMWLLKTSTDPEVFLAAARLVPQVEWPLDLDVSDMLHQLFDIFTSCVDIQKRIVPSLEEKASACTMALTHLYYGYILQPYPVRDTFPVCGMDLNVFEMIYWAGMRRTEHTVLDTTINLFFSNAIGSAWDSSLSEACPDSIPEQLSHLLPYHFVTGRVTKDIETLAITVISKLLSSPASPSNQIVANCTLLACVMVGTRVDKKDIVRIDKSSALPRLRESLSAQFQKALWAWDGGELDKYSTGIACRALSLLDIICRILELAEHSYDPPSSPFHTMRNLDACRKIYLRARSSEHNHPSVSLGALRKALHFTFATATISWDHDQVWANQSWSERVSHSPEDFDWMVDYLDFIYSNDHEAAHAILLLLDIMGVWCSPAKQHLFIERLISCMDSNMPTYLRHAALRAAHGAREEIASIHIIDDARLRDIVLTKLSPTILSVLCPHPGTTLANDGPGPFFGRDKCYVELIFALARNSDWHPHLFGDRHIDWCISMLPEYYDSGYSAQIFYIAGILLQIAPEQTSATSLSFVTEQQWWDLMSSAWNWIPDDFYNTRLLALVDGTKKYMQIASKSDLEPFIWNVNRFLERLEEMGLEMQGLEQGEGIAVAVKELRTAASNMLESFDQELLVP
ncbi:hypothetical protein BDR06DRAFT_148752 [Suillus hirtellus]|nr:hypothetical protein BDR06DRAFT_148752 [Suillus hirtellus]